MKKYNFSGYNTFGLKKMWIKLFFLYEEEFLNSSELGPRQKDALILYLRHINFINKKKEFTEEYYLLKKIFLIKGIDDLNLWSIIWINLSFCSNLFNYYNMFKINKYDRNDLLKIYSFTNLKNRTLLNGINSLLGTFQNTPIGDKLKIGIVKKVGRNRILVKEGGYNFSGLIYLYNLYKYYNKFNVYIINIYEIENNTYSPQKILIKNSKDIEKKLIECYYPDLFKFENGFIILNKNLSYMDVIKKIVKEN